MSARTAPTLLTVDEGERALIRLRADLAEAEIKALTDYHAVVDLPTDPPEKLVDGVHRLTRDDGSYGPGGYEVKDGVVVHSWMWSDTRRGT
jgi:hypothetical protein